MGQNFLYWKLYSYWLLLVPKADLFFRIIKYVLIIFYIIVLQDLLSTNSEKDESKTQ